ncbi:MAG: TRAP transporter small permease [Burkholderiales bacterium]
MGRWLETCSRGLSLVAALFLATMMLLTVIDVILRGVFSVPIQGTLEFVELLLACLIFIGLPTAFLRDENLVVDVIDGPWPRWVPRMKRVSLLIATLALAVMLWQSWIAAHDTLTFGDVTSDLSLPRIIYWVPVLFGMIATMLATLALLFQPLEPRR